MDKTEGYLRDIALYLKHLANNTARINANLKNISISLEEIEVKSNPPKKEEE